MLIDKESADAMAEQQTREINNLKAVQKDERTKLYSTLCNLSNELEDDLELDLEEGESGYKTYEASYRAVRKHTRRALNRAIKKALKSMNDVNVLEGETNG